VPAHFIIDTGNWWPAAKALVSPEWIDDVSWDEKTVFVKLSREAIKGSPEYRTDTPLTRAYETALYQHYNRPKYWVDEPAAKKPSH
jgi:hypothetical protein